MHALALSKAQMYRAKMAFFNISQQHLFSMLPLFPFSLNNLVQDIMQIIIVLSSCETMKKSTLQSLMLFIFYFVYWWITNQLLRCKHPTLLVMSIKSVWLHNIGSVYQSEFDRCRQILGWIPFKCCGKTRLAISSQKDLWVFPSRNNMKLSCFPTVPSNGADLD